MVVLEIRNQNPARLHVTMPTGLRAEITAIAEAAGTTASAVARAAIQAGLPAVRRAAERQASHRPPTPAPAAATESPDPTPPAVATGAGPAPADDADAAPTLHPAAATPEVQDLPPREIAPTEAEEEEGREEFEHLLQIADFDPGDDGEEA